MGVSGEPSRADEVVRNARADLMLLKRLVQRRSRLRNILLWGARWIGPGPHNKTEVIKRSLYQLERALWAT
jgi:hypothetical protein